MIFVFFRVSTGKTDKKLDDDKEYSDKKEPSMVQEAAPYVIVVQGPPKVGKSLLIKLLLEHYTNEKHVCIQGPITIASANGRRIQFVECPNNMNGMIDAAKYADAVLLLIDSTYGFEMETFEFLNLLQVHGMPKVLGVLTNLDEIKDELIRTITEESLVEKFRTKIHEGARIFCLPGHRYRFYQKSDVQELGDFLSLEEFHTLPSRATHPYLLVDRFKDVTSPEEVCKDGNCARNIILYGYLRGCDIKKGTKVHIAGVGDYPLADVTISADPCPLPSPDSNELKITIGKNSLDEEPQFEIESFSTGTYLAFGVLAVPSEMVTNRDPCQPILVGGINPAEQTTGYLQAKLKRHNWQMNSLKSNDPIVVSVGWRRYQTLPVYTRDHGGRRRMLQYTSEDENCVATFWGPLAPSGAGVVVLRSSADNKAAFQILATAVVLDYHAVKIWKKIKRIGTPCLILKKTALIKGLFTSDDEVDLFRNLKIKTEDGIRGAVIEAAKPDCGELNRQPTEGIARCTFDRMIHMGSIIVMSAWSKIEVPSISNQPMAVLEPSNSVLQSMDSIEAVSYCSCLFFRRKKKLDGARDCKAHVLVIHENRIAAEDLRKSLTENFYEKVKIDLVHARGTREQQRAVIFSEPMPFGWDSELRREVLSVLQKKHNKSGLGLITTVVSRKPGIRCDMGLNEIKKQNKMGLGFIKTVASRKPGLRHDKEEVSTGTAGGQVRE
ncbi:hypothetical protein MKW92_040531 [Papaver armeniacum]|nr:hypothetical protein MKW92_040531 [Papaver armeniacum]